MRCVCICVCCVVVVSCSRCSCCHLSHSTTRHGEPNGRATAATPPDDPARPLNPNLHASQPPTVFAACACWSDRHPIHHHASYPSPSNYCPERPLCARLASLFSLNQPKRKSFSSSCLPRDVDMQCREPGPQVLSRRRGCSAANGHSGSSSQDCSVVEVLTDRVPRFPRHLPSARSAT